MATVGATGAGQLRMAKGSLEPRKLQSQPVGLACPVLAGASRQFNLRKMIAAADGWMDPRQ